MTESFTASGDSSQKEWVSPKTAAAFELGKNLPSVIDGATSREWIVDGFKEFYELIAKERGGFEDPERPIPHEVLYKKMTI